MAIFSAMPVWFEKDRRKGQGSGQTMAKQGQMPAKEIG